MNANKPDEFPGRKPRRRRLVGRRPNGSIIYTTQAAEEGTSAIGFLLVRRPPAAAPLPPTPKLDKPRN